jgi:hypothetical protein
MRLGLANGAVFWVLHVSSELNFLRKFLSEREKGAGL